MPNLTDEYVDNLAPATGGQYVVRDERVKGFYVVVGRRAKTFTVQCDVPDDLGRRRTKKIALGRFPELRTKKAREQAMAHLGELKVSGRYTEKPKDVTLGAAWQHMRDNELPRTGARPRTIEGYTDTYERLMQDWLDVPVRRFAERPGLVDERHHAITKRHGPYAANHFGRAFRRLYRYAQAKLEPGLPVINWGAVIAWNKEQRRNTGMGTEDLPAWFAQWEQLPNPIRREFHLFTLLSGSRPEALSRARWEHLDVRRRALRIPEPKGGPDRTFAVPLSRPMLGSLWRARAAGRMMHRKQAETWVFPAGSKAGHIVEWKENRDLLGKWGVDLRQSYVNAAEVIDVSERTLKRLLNHKTQDVTMGYGDRDRIWHHLVAEQERMSAHLLAQAKNKQLCALSQEPPMTFKNGLRGVKV